MRPCSFTMIFSSAIAGTYAPPVESVRRKTPEVHLVIRTCDRDPMHNGYLGYPKCGHLGHIVKYASEMLLVREHLYYQMSLNKRFV